MKKEINPAMMIGAIIAVLVIIAAVMFIPRGGTPTEKSLGIGEPVKPGTGDPRVQGGATGGGDAATPPPSGVGSR